MIIFYLWLVVQIVVESLPISSSGHCALLERIAKYFGVVIPDGVMYIDSIAIKTELVEHYTHGVTMLILAIYFFDRWFFLLKHIGRCYKIIGRLIGLAFIADCCTAIFYGIFHAYGKPPLPLGVGFIITALILGASRKAPVNKQAVLTWQKAILLGIVQGIALLPGISRFASTYVAARYLALTPERALATSFMIQWPLIAAAFAQSLYAIMQYPPAMILFRCDILIVLGVAGIIAYGLFSWAARMAYTNNFWKFGLYMGVPVILWLFLAVS